MSYVSSEKNIIYELKAKGAEFGTSNVKPLAAQDFI